jgi:hypothetical protein
MQILALDAAYLQHDAGTQQAAAEVAVKVRVSETTVKTLGLQPDP